MPLEERIRNEYNENKDMYKEFRDCIEKILERLFNKEYHIQPITSRIKTVDSIVNKILRPGNSYEKLEDIPDIIGLRIITHFDDDVDRIGEIIKSQFKPSKDNIEDRRRTIDVDRFDYLSLHFLVSVDKDRHGAQNYEDFKGMRAEIQVRSIAQHAWAEISRVLGYNTKYEVPRPVKRNFARLAGLFEIADAEFIRIRDNIDNYKEQLPTEINTATKVTINKDSLKEFVRTNETIKALDKDIAQISDYKLEEHDASFGYYANQLEYLEIDSIKKLKDGLETNKELIKSFASFVANSSEIESIVHGISIFYQCYILVLQKQNEISIEKYFDDMEIGPTDKRDGFIKDIKEWYKTNKTLLNNHI